MAIKTKDASMVYTDHRVDLTEPSQTGYIAISQYVDTEIALMLVDEDNDELCMVTVALHDALRHVGPSHVWLKGWSENLGIPEALQAAGLVRLTGETHATGFAQAQLAEVLPPLAKDIEAYLAEMV